MKDPTFFNNKEDLFNYNMAAEPQHCVDSANRAETILDITSEKADIPAMISKCENLNSTQKEDLQELLLKHESLFDGTVGDWKTDPVSLELKPGATPYHGKPYPVTVHSRDKFKKELKCLISLGILEKDSNSPWAAPSFAIPKKNPNEVRFLTDFRQLNPRIVRKPFPLPKIKNLFKWNRWHTMGLCH